MPRSLWLCALLLSTPCASAGPYSDLIVFGDSLSDVGNVLSNPFIDVLLPIDDFENRFSNGPVYSERLSEGLGLGPLVRSEDGGDNFANGGAETNGPNSFFAGSTFIDSLIEQVDTYSTRIGPNTPDPTTLFVLFIGANDFLLANQTDPTIPAGVVSDQFNRLVNAGARQFLGINLPLLGLTPDRFGDEALSNRTRSYNSALAGVYDAVELENPGVTIHRLDVEALLSDLLAEPAPLGFTNVTTPGQDQPGDSFDRAPGFAFWDGVHPTRELHALLGEAAIRTVLPEGDYDRDGVLGPADSDTWRAAYGTAFNASLGQTPSLAGDGNGDGRIDAADYTLWRDRSAQPVIGVPEPGSLLLAAMALLGAPRRRTTASQAAR